MNNQLLVRFKSVFCYFLVLLIFVSFSSCKEESEELQAINYDYFPLEVGQQLTYEVDSTIFDFDGSLKIRNYSRTKVVQEVVDTFIDEEGLTNYIIYQNESGLDSNNMDYIGVKVNSAKLVDRRIEWVENNFRLVRLVFPTTIGKQWNPTLFINESEIITIAGESIQGYKNWSGEIIDYQVSEQIGDNSYNDVLTVQLADDENALEKRYVIEKYAKGIGLIYKKMMLIDTQDITSDEDWEIKGEKGFIMEQVLIP